MGTKYWVTYKFGKHALEGNCPTPDYLHATEAANMGHYLIKTRQYCLGSLDMNLGLLNNCTACSIQASQVSMQPGD